MYGPDTYDKGLDYFEQQQQKAFHFYFLMVCRFRSGNKVQPLTATKIKHKKYEITNTFSNHSN